MRKSYLLKSKFFGLISSLVLLFSGNVAAQDVRLDIGPTEYLTNSTYNFGSTFVSSTIGPITFTITGLTGGINLTGTPIVSISGANMADFTIDQTGMNPTLTNGQSTTFTITFTPSGSGLRVAQISIPNNDVGTENPYNITLNGTGVVPTINVTDPVKKDFCLNTNTTLGDIILTETGGNEFQVGSNYLFLTAPTGFEFVTTSGGTITYSGADFTAASYLFKSTSVFGIAYTVTGTANINILTIPGIQLKATALTAPGSVEVEFGAGSTPITGLTVGDPLATVSTALTNIALASVSPRCTNAATNVTLGGTYTLSTGTGAATFSSDTYASLPVAGAISGSIFRPSVAGGGTHTVTYTVNTSGGCSFTATTAIDINSAPNVTLSIVETSGTANDDNAVCAQDAIELHGNGADTYSFIKNNNYGSPIGSTNGMTYNASSFADNDNFSVIGTATNGCKDTSTTTPVDKFTHPSLTWNPAQTSFSYAANANNLRTNGTVTPNTGVFSGPGVYYDNTDVTYYFKASAANLGGNTVTYTVTNANGCSTSQNRTFTVASGTVDLGGWGPNHCLNSGMVTVTYPVASVTGGRQLYYEYYNYALGTYVYGWPGTSGGNYVFNLTPSELSGNTSAPFTAYIYIYEYDGNYYFEGYESASINPQPVVSINNNFFSPIYYHCPNETAMVLNTTPATTAATASFTYSANAGFVTNAGNVFSVNWGSGYLYPTSNSITFTHTDATTGCSASTTVSGIYVDPPGSVPTVTPSTYTYCSGDYVSNLHAQKQTNYYTVWYSVNTTTDAETQVLADFANQYTTNTYYTPGALTNVTNNPATFRYRVKQSNTYQTCLSNSSANLDVTVNPAVTVNAGINRYVCGNGSSINVTGTKTIPTMYGAVAHTWSTTGDGTITNPNNTTMTYLPGANDRLAGTVNLIMTSDDPDGNTTNGCPSSASSTLLTVTVPATVNAGGPYNFCASDVNTQLSASISSNVTATWTGANAVNLSSTSITNPYYNATVAQKNGGVYNNTTAAKAPSVITLSLVSSDPDGGGTTGPCPTVSSNATINIYPQLTVNAGTDLEVCAGTSIDLEADVLLGNVSRTKSAAPSVNNWYVITGGGTVSATGPDNFLATYNATGNILTNTGELGLGGNITLRIISDDPDGTGPCLDASDDVNIKIYQQPRVFAGNDTTFCANDVIKLNGSLLTSAVTSVTWSGKTPGEFSDNTVRNPILTSNTPSDYLGGTYNNTSATKAPVTFTLTLTGNDPFGPCTALSDNVDVTINPKLTVNAGTDINVCAGTAINLTGNVKLGDVDRLKTAAPSVNSWSIISGLGTLTPTGPDNFLCTYNPSGNALTNTGELGLGGNITLRLSSSDPDGTGPCLASTDDIDIVINQRARVFAGNDTSYCANDVMKLNGSVLTPQTTSVTWSGRPATDFSDVNGTKPVYTTSSPAELLGSTYNPATGTKLPVNIIFTITGNDPAGPCPAESDNVQVSINPKLIVNAGTDYSICGHKLIPNAFRTVATTANIKLGDADRLSTAAVNSWSVLTGSGAVSGTNFSSNFNVSYQPSGVLADSGNVVSSGTGEFGNLSTITLRLSSQDPDGPTGPCLASFDDVDITIQPRPLPHFSGFVTEYCKNTPSVRPEGNLSYRVSENAVFSGTAISLFGDVYKFDPQDASIPNTGATFPIRYKHTDANTCNNYVDTLVDVFPIPVVDFITSSRCQYDTITFTETATIDNSVFAASSEIDWDWAIDGDTTQNVFPLLPVPTYSLNTPSTQYAFANYGNHNIKLIVTSNSGGALNCVNKKETTMVFGPYPATNYSWSRPCSVDSVVFVNNTTIPTGYTNTITWNMNGAGAYKNSTSPTSQNPQHKFTQPGIYNVTLTAVTTTYGCTKVKQKEVYVVPTYSVTATNPYDSSFATTRNWAPSSAHPDSTYSWQHGTPAGKSSITPGHNVWVTNRTGNYKRGELSYLNSPCFNFSQLDKPMMVLKKLSASTNLAGAVVEVTTGNNNPWVTLGAIGTGINWYETPGVVGLIGANSSNPTAQGFSGEEDGNVFDVSRIGLSQYANTDTVRFRIAFGSSNVNDQLNQRDGFALDSIWIGNRFKSVLLEHFTNSLCATCPVANDTVNNIQTNRPSDVISVHYHTSFPGTDNMNLKNPADPSSKVLYYGISGVPRTQLDGVKDYDEYGNTTDAINYNAIDSKALENAKFSMDLTSKKTGLNLDVKAQIVAKEVFNQDLVLNVVVLENYIAGTNVGGNQSGYRWVLKKMLPDAAGSYISRTWAVGDTVKMPYNWNFVIGDFYDTSRIEIVAFVQNYQTKEVYQAVKVSSSGNSGSPVITSVDVQDIAENLLVFPVPADNEINVLFGSDLLHDTPYTLSDDMGRVVEKGTVEQGTRMLTFNSKKFASGMYYLSLTKEDGSKLNRKIVVIH